MTLEVTVRHAFGTFTLDVRFGAGPGLTVLFGRSGSGKTTLLNAIAGLLQPDSGRIVADGEILLDTETGISVPKHRRRIGYVFQEGRLFPHLTVRQNLLFGRGFAPRAARRGNLDDVAGLLGIAHLLDRRPAHLSGGEKQRVAIGRALLASPRVLLMDEPLASLDGPRKAEILPYIERLRDEFGVPIVYVSHAVDEVVRLATTVVLLSDGKVEAAGPIGEVMARIAPDTTVPFYESGAVLECRVASHDRAAGLTVLRSSAGDLRVPILDLSEGAPIRLRVRERDVLLASEAPRGLSALNVLTGTVAEIGPDGGPTAQVRIDCGGEAILARVTRYSVGALGLELGRPVHVVIKSVALDRGAGELGRAELEL